MPKMKLPKGQTMDANDVAGLMGGTSLPVGLIATLSKEARIAQALKNLDNVKGSPFEAAAKFFQQRWPRLFGNSELKVSPIANKGASSVAGDFQAGGRLPGFRSNRIRVNPNADVPPAETLGHEYYHAADAAGRGPSNWTEMYNQLNNTRGYDMNPLEVNARYYGDKVKLLTEASGGEQPIFRELERDLMNSQAYQRLYDALLNMDLNQLASRTKK